MRSKNWIQAGRFSAILIAAAAISACSSDDDSKTLKDTQNEPPSENCEFGGKVHLSGKDLNDDGVLQASEIEKREYECNADPGTGTTDGTERLNETYPEPAGENCEFGGTRTITGIDKNEDGSLSFSEIDDTSYECDVDPALPEGERLTEVSSIGPTPDCVNGGQEIASGIDVDESGDLQAGEIDSRGFICAGELAGGTLIDIEELAVGDAACANGGKIIHSGADIDEDGALQETERTDSLTLCAPAEGVCDGVPAIRVQSAQLGPDPYWAYSEGDVYPIRVRLSRALDDASMSVVQFGEAFGPNADFVASQSTTEPGLITANWEAVLGDARTGHLMLADECGVTFATVDLPHVFGAHAGVRATVEYKEYAVGDTYHVCWESRNADSCRLQQHSGDPMVIAPTEGCHDFILDDDNFAWDYVSGLMIECGPTGGYFTSTNMNQPVDPEISEFSLMNGLKFPSAGGELQLRWTAVHVTDCEIVTPDGRTPVDPVVTDSFNVPIYTSGYISLECEDAAGEPVVRRYNQPIVVGAGIEMFHASADTHDGDIFWGFGVKTHFLDGTCDVTITRGEFSMELTDVAQLPEFNSPSYARAIYRNETLVGEGGDIETEDELTAEVRCSNADGSNETVMTYSH